MSEYDEWAKTMDEPVTRESLIRDLKALQEALGKIPVGEVPSFNERARTVQNVGGYILRRGRLDAIIRELEHDE